jgi:hypothetical protein
MITTRQCLTNKLYATVHLYICVEMQGNDASSQAQATATAVIAALPYTTGHTSIQHYNDVLLTGDVTSIDFRSTLPLSLDAFCSHLERCANEVIYIYIQY